MPDHGEPLHEAFRPPTAAPSSEPEPLLDSRLVRWHLVALFVALMVHGVVTTIMQAELFDAGPRWSVELFNMVQAIHGLSRYTIIGPVLMGLLPAMVLPSPLKPRPRGLAFFGVVAWCGGTLLMVLWLPFLTIGLFGVLLANAVFGVGLILSMLAAVLAAVRGDGKALFRGAPATGLGLLVTTVGLMLLLQGDLAQSSSPQAVLGRGLRPLVFAIAAPGLLVLAIASIEPRRVAAGSSAVPTWALVGSLVGLVARPLSQLVPEVDLLILVLSILALPVIVFTLVRAAQPLLAGRAWLREPDALALLLALLALGIGAVDSTFLGMLSVDIHLHDTYFVTALLHLAAAALLLLVVAAAMQQAPAWLGRIPLRGLGMAGVGGLGLGLGLATVAMAMLGQQGMPRMYFTYVPQFETLHQLVGVGGMIAALGLGLVGLASARGPRAHVAPVDP